MRLDRKPRVRGAELERGSHVEDPRAKRRSASRALPGGAHSCDGLRDGLERRRQRSGVAVVAVHRVGEELHSVGARRPRTSGATLFFLISLRRRHDDAPRAHHRVALQRVDHRSYLGRTDVRVDRMRILNDDRAHEAIRLILQHLWSRRRSRRHRIVDEPRDVPDRRVRVLVVLLQVARRPSTPQRPRRAARGEAALRAALRRSRRRSDFDVVARKVRRVECLARRPSESQRRNSEGEHPGLTASISTPVALAHHVVINTVP